MGGSEILPLILGSSGITAVVLAIMNAVFNRFKMKADATAVLTGAAGGLVTALQTDNGRLRAENAIIRSHAERKARAERARDAAFRRQLEAHHEYDVDIAKTLRQAGFDVPDPPVLEFPDYHYDESDLIGSDGPAPSQG